MKRRKNPGELVVLTNPRRRNPSGLVSGSLGIIKSGAVGALGGLANDALYGFGKKFLPAAAQSGMGRTATKLVSAALLAVVARKVIPGQARDLAVGAATVVLHEAGKEFLNTNMPSLPLGDMEDNLLGYDSSAPYVNGMGSYMAQTPQKVGEYLPQ